MNSEELAYCYEVTIELVYRFFFYKVLNREVAEDLTSQTFLRFAKEIASKDKEIKDAKKYLFGIAKYVLLDYLRQKYKQMEHPLTEADEELLYVEDEKSKPKVDVIDLLAQLLPKLPEKQRSILDLRFVQKKTIKEIANLLGKDVNYVSTTQKRAFQSMRILLSCTDKSTNIVEEDKDE